MQWVGERGESLKKKAEPKPVKLYEPLDWTIPEDNSALDFLVSFTRNPLHVSLYTKFSATHNKNILILLSGNSVLSLIIN